MKSFLSVAAALVAVLTFAGASCAHGRRAPANRLSPTLPTDIFVRIARERASSVVLLHTLSQPPISQDLPAVVTIKEGLGSGLVIDANGLILTNAHVVAGAETIHVRTSDGDDVKTTLIGMDLDTDLAVVRATDARGLRPAPLGDSDRLEVGEWVVAIGNPFGLYHTVTLGIVSAKARSVDDSGVEFLQTDAAINPGNSGGPLFDLTGAVVGITSKVLSGIGLARGENVGLNLAIPARVIKEELPYLLAGTVTHVHGWIGITTSTLTREGAQARDLRSGLVVTGVTGGGPAHQSGLRVADVIVGILDHPSMPLRDFYLHVRHTPPGSIIPLQVSRDGELLELPIEVGRRPVV